MEDKNIGGIVGGISVWGVPAVVFHGIGCCVTNHSSVGAMGSQQ